MTFLIKVEGKKKSIIDIVSLLFPPYQLNTPKSHSRGIFLE